MKAKPIKKSTESSSKYRNLEKMSFQELIYSINEEDKSVAYTISKQLTPIKHLAEAIFDKLQKGGRLFYIGAGTSGRLGVVDASECPPTFGVSPDKVIGLIAGGDGAIRKSVEYAEDNVDLSWEDLKRNNISAKDIVVGIAASGTTPYVVHGLEKCQSEGITTGSISCNQNAKISEFSDFPVEVIVGPEFVTGSTRMKAGTAQKMVLNMLSTSVMIKLGHVVDNKMVDMQLSNDKLIDRGTKLIMESSVLNYERAKSLLLKYGSVRAALKNISN